MENKIILSDTEVRNKINRIAYQIYESNLEEKEVYIVGIASSGYKIASLLAQKVEQISPIKVHLCELEINKKDLTAPFRFSCQLEKLKGHSVVLVDDVLNSGAVLIYAVRFLLGENLKKLNTAVLVDRNHKRFPVKVDFKGMSLSTTLHEHVQVLFDKNDEIMVEFS